MTYRRDGMGWVQSGYIRNGLGKPVAHYSQINQGPGGQFTTVVSDQQLFNGDQYSYRQTYVVNGCQNGNCFVSQVGGTVLATTRFDPVTAWGTFGTFYNEYSGEVSLRGSDVPGTPGSNSSFRSMKYQYTKDSHVFAAQPCGDDQYLLNDSRFAVQRPACDALDVWTARP